jgi:hypothetical protein
MLQRVVADCVVVHTYGALMNACIHGSSMQQLIAVVCMIACVDYQVLLY